MARHRSTERRIIFLDLFCHDRIARHPRHRWHWCLAGPGVAGMARHIRSRKLQSSRDRRLVLALCRYRLGVLIPSFVFGRTPLMEKVVAPKIYFRTCIALLALLALTWMTAYVDLGPFNLIFALAIAICKAVLIALFFMHIKGSSRLLHLAAFAGIIWLLFLISLTFSDYFTRGWVPLNH